MNACNHSRGGRISFLLNCVVWFVLAAATVVEITSESYVVAVDEHGDAVRVLSASLPRTAVHAVFTSLVLTCWSLAFSLRKRRRDACVPGRPSDH